MHVLEVSYFIWKRKPVNYKLDLGGILMATSYNVASEKTNLQEIGFHRSNIYYLQNLSQTVLMGGKFGLQEEFFFANKLVLLYDFSKTCYIQFY